MNINKYAFLQRVTMSSCILQGVYVPPLGAAVLVSNRVIIKGANYISLTHGTKRKWQRK